MKNDNDGLNIVQKLQPNLNVKFHADQSGNKQMYKTQQFDQQFQLVHGQENPCLQSQMKNKQFNQNSHQNPVFYPNNQQQVTYGDGWQSQGYTINSNRPPQLYPADSRFCQPGQGDSRSSQQNFSNVGISQTGSSQIIPVDNRQSHIHPEVQTSQFDSQQQSTNHLNRIPQGYADGQLPQQSCFGNNQVQNAPVAQYQQSTYQSPALQVDNQQTYQNVYFGENHQAGYAPDNRVPRQPVYPDNRQLQTAYSCDNRRPQEYAPDSRQQFHSFSNEQVVQPEYPANRRLLQTFPPDNRPPQSAVVQGYQQSDNRLQPGRQCPPDNRQYQQDYFMDNKQTGQQHSYFENRPPQPNYPPDRPDQPYYQDDRPQQAFSGNQPPPGNSRGYSVGETRRLNQPQQAYQGQNSPQRQLPNVGYQREQQRSGHRESSDTQERRQQIIPHAEFSNPTSHQVRRQLPSARQHSPSIDQSSRKRFPLQKYNSEEQHSGIQDEYERQHHNDAQVGSKEAQYARGVNRHQRAKNKGPRQRSLSLDSQERGDHYHSKSRTSSQEHSRGEDEYDSPPERLVTESKRSTQRNTSDSGSLSKGTKRSTLNSAGQPSIIDRTRKTNTWLEGENIDETRPAERQQGSASKESKRLSEHTQRSRPTLEVQKGENYCPQHKKFTSTTTTSSNRPVRRLLPKEPLGSSVLRKNTRTQVSYY